MKWFKGVGNLEELRKLYKKLVIKHHPDNGGSDAVLAEINAEYDKLFKKFKDGYEQSESYKTATDRQKQSYDWQKDKQIRDMIMKLSKFPGLEIEICGTWIYVSGETYKYKKELKALGLSWNRSRECWIIYFDDYYQYHKTPVSMSYIRTKYGSTVLKTKEAEKEYIDLNGTSWCCLSGIFSSGIYTIC